VPPPSPPPPQQLNDRQRNQIRNLAVDLEQLGHILRQQDDPGCLQPYHEAMELAQQISDRGEEAVVAFNLGHAYKGIPDLRDLGQAQHWYQQALDLFGEHDTLNRAKIAGQLGIVAYQRFRDARDAGADQETLLGYLNDAARAHHQALDLFPADAVNEHAVAHSQLGVIYSEAGDTDQALAHYRKAIHYHERQDNTYRAGQSRFNAALALAQAGRRHDALLYARAALRDFQTVGLGAATDAEQTRQLITELE
jgi:tetratricopeptide (TPR) repeat protein